MAVHELVVVIDTAYVQVLTASFVVQPRSKAKPKVHVPYQPPDQTIFTSGHKDTYKTCWVDAEKSKLTARINPYRIVISH